MARVIEDKVNDSAIELLKINIDSKILANSLLMLQKKAVQTPKKVKKFKKVKLTANFQGFDPKKAPKALARSNKIKKAKAKDASKLVTAKRTAKQRDDESTLKDRETKRIQTSGWGRLWWPAL